ncbi:helix-turn-helix transcriptional regulator [Embleya scabrispora]|uniref:helix-turn-helix transcriptional regulator n=1 Tax=Embleya scabrispora TaxID=159449 RepID=UPI00036605D1|nr:helix-turn-helix domain-containing protein [Embleya scabrispora]MYS83195.1 helix-turn-helix domain-containing protein [Streptomyces sp. SID5474]
MHTAPGIGRRIAYWRARRGLTQAEFARLMGRSVRWVEDVEAGHRQADPRLSVLAEAALVLHIGIDRLLPAERNREHHDHDPLAAVRAVLRRADTALVVGAGAAPADIEVLRRELTYGWTAYAAADYGCLDRVVSSVLAATTEASGGVAAGVGPGATVAAGGPDESTGEGALTPAAVRSAALGLASAVAHVYGEPDLAWRAADRAVTSAGRSADVVVLARAAHRLTDAMVGHEGASAAVEFALGAEADLASALHARGRAGRAALRTLRLGAALATARLGDRSATRDLLDAAERADPGAIHVPLHRVAAHVLLGEYARAIAARFTPAALGVLPRGRQARHLVDLARALAAVGRRGEAVGALLEAEAVAAQEIRCRPTNRRFVQEILRLDSSTDGDESRLRALAARCAGNGSSGPERAWIM